MLGSKNILTIRQKGFLKIIKTKIDYFYNLNVAMSYQSKIKNYEIMTPYGWNDLIQIEKFTNKKSVYKMSTDDFFIYCCNNQVFLQNNNNKIKIKQLIVGDLITTELGLKQVKNIVDIGEKEKMYRIKVKSPKNLVYVMGILLMK